MTARGFDVFISTGPIAAWRIQKADKEGKEEVEVSRRQLRKLHKLWGVFPSRRLCISKGVTLPSASPLKKKKEKGTEQRQKKKSTCCVSCFGCSRTNQHRMPAVRGERKPTEVLLCLRSHTTSPTAQFLLTHWEKQGETILILLMLLRNKKMEVIKGVFQSHLLF